MLELHQIKELCTACDDHNHAPCSSCDSKGTKMCTRCMGEGELLLYDFFVVSNSGDLCLTNIFPPSQNGAVEQILHERVFHLGKDKATETKNLLQGRMKPFENADECEFGAPSRFHTAGTRTMSVEGETLSVTDCEDLGAGSICLMEPKQIFLIRKNLCSKILHSNLQNAS